MKLHLIKTDQREVEAGV